MYQDSEIKMVIERAYIKGIHESQNREEIDTGFHLNFQMVVLNGDQLEKVTIDEWLNRIEHMKKENPELWNAEPKGDISILDVTGNAASVKIRLHKGNTYFSTDYMMLYKFDNGWKIVAKIFTTLE